MRRQSPGYTRLCTRDWSLMFCEDLHKANTDIMLAQFGWRYTDMLFVGKDGVVTVYCDSSEQRRGIIGMIEDFTREDTDWFLRRNLTIKRQCRDMSRMMTAVGSRPLNTQEDSDLASILKRVSRRNAASHAYYAVLMWGPITLETAHMKRRNANFIAEALKTREAVQDAKASVNGFYMSVASYVLGRQKLAKRLARFVSFGEMIGFLMDGTSFEKAELLKRTRGYVLSQAGLVSGVSARGREQPSKRGIAVEASSLSDCLRGRRAYPGKVTGRVKIVLSQRDFSSFKSGEVLVTPMTTPEYLPLLRRAAAVVTDEGGVTCHAAILCREYRKPCVVGTGRATQAFKTGDIVTVDATKQMVWRFQ